MKTKHSWVVLARCAGVVGTAILLLGASPLRAASASELLEQGIYSEETKGDLDGAVKLYQQVVAEGKAGEALAAQAQYRLGTCYYKKKQFTEATAAFEKLVSDFPNQKDLVARAQEYLAGTMVLLPAPWQDGEELQLDIKVGTGMKLGTMRTRVNSGETNGLKIWRLATHLYAGVSAISHVEVRADNFRPLHSRWKHTLLGDADAVYGPQSVEVKVAGKNETNKVECSGLVYDNEECLQLFRRLPVATNYSANLRILASITGGNLIGVKCSVAGLEKVEVPAGTFDCYRVELNIKQTFWYSADAHRYLVKFQANGVTAELTRIGQHQPGQPIQYQDASFSVAAPSDWLFFRPESKSGKTKALLYAFDSEGIASSELWVLPIAKLKPEAQKSLRDFAEQFIAEQSEDPDFKVRSDSWQARSVNGRPGISFIGDYVEAEVKKVSYGVGSFGETNAVQFVFQAPADKLEALRPEFESMVDSYKGQ